MNKPAGISRLNRVGRRFLAVSFICAFAVSSVFADGVRQRVRFARGTSSTTIRGAVIRGDRDRYIVGAQRGQTMTVKITALEDNAAFEIFFAGEQEALEGAGEEDDATEWTGKLPADNDYVIVVGGTRGNASYKLTVSIK
jgi:hypothetical protein